MQERFLISTLLLTLCAPALAADPVWYRPDQQPGTEEQVERGRLMFGACSGCHGPNGRGVVGMAPRINSGPYLAIVSNEFLRKTMVEGRPGTNMIPWGGALSPEDVDSVVAYIRSWQTEDGLELDESALQGSAKKGEKLFAENCERCHGPSGGGYAEDGMGIGIGGRAFLEAASDGMIRAVILNGKSGTPMESFADRPDAPFGSLSGKEIDSIIAYLREKAH